MNPLEIKGLPQSNIANFFGKSLLGFINQKKVKPESYSRMKEKQIAKRRARNKIAYKSRRKNRIIANKLHAKCV
jgi:hypothetical protein